MATAEDFNPELHSVASLKELSNPEPSVASLGKDRREQPFYAKRIRGIDLGGFRR